MNFLWEEVTVPFITINKKNLLFLLFGFILGKEAQLLLLPHIFMQFASHVRSPQYFCAWKTYTQYSKHYNRAALNQIFQLVCLHVLMAFCSSRKLHARTAFHHTARSNEFITVNGHMLHCSVRWRQPRDDVDVK